MTRLSVNINKIATLRNARGHNVPDLLSVAADCERFGADGITVHPRPDERHIRKADVYALKEIVKTEFNIEGYPSPDFLKMVEEVTIKVDKVDLSRLLAALFRLNYNVTASYHQDEFSGDLQDRYDSFMNYLNV